MKSLELLCQEHEGKICDKWSLYLTEYENLFDKYRERPVRLLEIGVQNGGSLEIWRKFFPDAERIVGCDIDRNCASLQFDDPRIGLVLADANTDAAERQISAQCTSFDIVIDDGSHRSDDIVRSFSRYFPYLDDGGVYVVEDLHCSYWKEYPGSPFHAGGLFHPSAAIGFFKLLVDIVNHEHWGIDKTRMELLLNFQQRHGVHLDENALGTIHSVKFVNSLCIIKKKEARQNILGARVVSGIAEMVAPGIGTLDGTTSQAPDQRNNAWSVRGAINYEDLLRAEVAETIRLVRNGDRRIAELEARVARTAVAIDGAAADAAAKALRARLDMAHAELRATHARLGQMRVELRAAEIAASAATRQSTDRDAAHVRERAEWEAQLAGAVRAKEEAEWARAGFEQELTIKRDELAGLLSSTLWQSTYPLRLLGARLPSPVRRDLRRVARVIWRAARLTRLKHPPAPRVERPVGEAAAVTLEAPTTGPAQQRTASDIVMVSGFPGTPSEAYRVLNPLSVLQEFYRVQAITAGEIGFHAELLKQASIIVLFRVPWSPQLADIVKAARANGCLIVYDIDDYVFEPAIAKPSIIDGMRFLSPSEVKTYHVGVQAYRKALEQADYCILTTEFLAARVRELGKTAYVLPNAVDPGMLRRYDEALRRRQQRGSNKKLRIGYAAGTLTHQRDFAVVRTVLASLLAARDDLILTIVGHIDIAEYPDLAALSHRIEIRPPVPHNELPEELARFDINIAPLEIGNPFCEAKSELKFFNAALVEVPTVASATAPFRAVIRHGQSGFLAETETQWRDALNTLLDDSQLRTRVGKLARSEAMRQFGPGTMRTQVKLVFDELWRHRRPVTRSRGAGYDQFLYAINYAAAPLHPAQARPPARPRIDQGAAPLNLHWIVPAFAVGWGGMTNIFRIIQQLEKSGHRNTLWVHNLPPSLPNGRTVSEYYRDLIVNHFPPIEAEIYPLPSDLDQISGDAVIATDHFSAYPARAVAKVARRFYFLQDNEPAFNPAGYAALFAEATYRFGFDALSNGEWLHALAQRYGMWSMKWEQAADPEYYFTRDTEQRLPSHVAFYARQETPRRAVELGYLAFELLARDGFEFHVDLFGGAHPPPDLPYPFTHHGVLSGGQLGDLYRRASIGMVFSATNYSIIPREMMACGLPVLELNSESSRCAFPDGVAELADPTPESVAAHLKSLLLDEARRAQLARQALDFLVDFSWEKSGRDIEEALLFRLGRMKPAARAPELLDSAAGQ